MQILITGTPRSGTTLLTQMLSAHSNIAGTYDTVNFMRFHWDFYKREVSKNKAKSIVEEVTNRVNQRWNMQGSKDKILSHVLKDSLIPLSDIYDSIMKELVIKNTGCEHWLEKTTNVWEEAPSFLDMFPEGHVIHIIRDPYASFASWKKFTHAEGSDYLGFAFNLLGSQVNALRHNAMYERYHLVHFEDLISAPKKVLIFLCTALNIDFEERLFDTSLFKDKSGKPWKGNSMFKSTQDTIDAHANDKYLDTLTQLELTWVALIMKEYKHYNPGLASVALDLALANDYTSKLLIKHLHTGQTSESFPKDPKNPSNWESEKVQLAKYKETNAKD